MVKVSWSLRTRKYIPPWGKLFSCNVCDSYMSFGELICPAYQPFVSDGCLLFCKFHQYSLVYGRTDAVTVWMLFISVSPRPYHDMTFFYVLSIHIHIKMHVFLWPVTCVNNVLRHLNAFWHMFYFYLGCFMTDFFLGFFDTFSYPRRKASILKLW